jgi:hypothetical protein
MGWGRKVVDMGYSTDFEGAFLVTPRLTAQDRTWLWNFAATRHEDDDDPASVVGLYCQWIPSDDGAIIEWDGGEKFYNYVEWIEYLVHNILDPKGPFWTEPALSQRYVLSGEVTWQGEGWDDKGMIRIVDNDVKVLQGVVTYEELP